MPTLVPMVRLLVRDFVVLGLLGGIAGWLWRGPAAGAGFLAGCLWLGYNIASMGWLIFQLSNRNSTTKLFVALAACAKIPVAYLILLWLLTGKLVQPMAVVAALATLPVVILFQGLLSAGGKRLPVKSREEEVC